MTREELKKRMDQGVLFLDGATGSNLIKAGMPKGVCTEQWVLQHPDVLLQLQRAYALAGSDIVYAPTFSANRLSLSGYGLEDEIKKINQELVALSRKAVGEQVLVAGDVTTVGKPIGSSEATSYEALLEIYKEQIELLAESGVDLIVAETLLSVEEAMLILDAAQVACDLPVMCSMTVAADGTAYFGGNALEAVLTLQEIGAAAVGINCSVGPDQLTAVVAQMAAESTVPVLVKPNAGMPIIDGEGNAAYNMDAEQFAKAMLVLADQGATLLGGCCGTTPEYIHTLKTLFLSERK